MNRRPDIIVINPDQMRADSLHHLGNPASYTPNLDSLADEGVSFSNAFCQNPVCVPSRCSFMTGTYPHTNGHRTMSYLLRQGEDNLYRILKNSGYYVWTSGRGDCLAGQQSKWFKECTSEIYNKCGKKPKDEGRGEKGDKRYLSFYRGEITNVESDGMCHDNDWVWTKGCEDLIRKTKPDEPIFAFLGLNNPHPPYHAEKRFLDLIDESKIPPAKAPSKTEDKKPSMQYELCDALGIADWDTENVTALRKTYLAQCARIDELTGRIIQALKDTGRYDNAAIFFFSDHGDFTADYGIPEKAQNLFDDCLVNVPLIVKLPKYMQTDNGINDNPVELIDFFATVLDITKTDASYTHFGRSLVETIADKTVSMRDFVCSEGGRLQNEKHCTEDVENYFGVVADEYAPRIGIQQKNDGQHTKAVMIRSKDYKYVMRLYETDEFYDLSKGEETNQIDNPEYQTVIADMRSNLLEWLFETADSVPKDKDARFSDDFYLETVNAMAGFKVSPLIKGVMKLTHNDFSSLVNKAIKLMKIDTNGFYNKKT